MAQVTVQLEVVTARGVDPFVGRLWDISHTGGCIALPGNRKIVVPAGSRLQMRDPMSQALYRLAHPWPGPDAVLVVQRDPDGTRAVVTCGWWDEGDDATLPPSDPAP